MSQLLYGAASKQQVLSNIGCFLAEKWPTVVETRWKLVKINNETYGWISIIKIVRNEDNIKEKENKTMNRFSNCIFQINGRFRKIKKYKRPKENVLLIYLKNKTKIDFPSMYFKQMEDFIKLRY